MTLDPTPIRVTYVTLHKDPYIKVAWKYVDTMTIFKYIDQDVNDPKWPFGHM